MPRISGIFWQNKQGVSTSDWCYFRGGLPLELNDAAIAKYVREKEKFDQMMDQISVKKAKDPL